MDPLVHFTHRGGPILIESVPAPPARRYSCNSFAASLSYSPTLDPPTFDSLTLRQRAAIFAQALQALGDQFRHANIFRLAVVIEQYAVLQDFFSEMADVFVCDVGSSLGERPHPCRADQALSRPRAGTPLHELFDLFGGEFRRRMRR